MDCEMSATFAHCASKGNILINSQHIPTNRDAGLSKEVLTSYQLALYNKVQGIKGIGHCNRVF